MRINKYGSAGFLLLTGALWAFVDCSSDEPATPVAASCVANTDCSDPLSCSFGRCHRQCKESRDCPNPQRCINGEATGVCQLEDEVKCVRTSDCKAPLTCATDSQCRNACANDRDCIAKQVCAVGGFCADLTEVTAGNRLIGEDAGGAMADGSGGSAGAGVGGAGGAGGATPDASMGGAGGMSIDGSLGADAMDAVATEAATDAGPGSKLYVRASSALLIYTLDQLAVDNSGPEPRNKIAYFPIGGPFVVDLDGNAWGDGTPYSGGIRRHLAADLAMSSGASTQLKQYDRLAGGQRLGVDALGNVWAAGMQACGGCPSPYSQYVSRLDRASLSAPTDGGDVPGVTSTLSVGYTGTTYNWAPNGIWFDAEGTLVLVEADSIKRYAASALMGSGAQNDPPTTQLSVSGVAATGSPGVWAHTAVAGNGDLWFLCGATKALCRFSKATLAAGGTATVPTGTLTVANFTPVSLAFDKDDNLWAISGTKLIRLPKADLQPTGDATSTPAVRINPPSGFGAMFSELVIPH
jgi:hypothetical protein